MQFRPNASLRQQILKETANQAPSIPDGSGEGCLVGSPGGPRLSPVRRERQLGLPRTLATQLPSAQRIEYDLIQRVVAASRQPSLDGREHTLQVPDEHGVAPEVTKTQPLSGIAILVNNAGKMLSVPLPDGRVAVVLSVCFHCGGIDGPRDRRQCCSVTGPTQRLPVGRVRVPGYGP